MSKILITFFFLLLAQAGFSQKKYTTAKTADGKQRTLLERAVRLASLDQLDAAISDLEKALKNDPAFIDAQVEWANVKYQQQKLAEAETGYEKALAIDSLYEVNVFYSLAMVEFDQEKFGESATHFERFLQQGDRISEKRRNTAQTYLKNVRFAAEALKNPVPFDPVNLGPQLNTPESEYLPMLTVDGETLIYTAVRGGQEDFYRSQKKEGVWQTGEPIGAVNTSDNEGAHSISADGKLLVLTACGRRDGAGSCDLFFSELKNGQWTSVKNIGAPVNTAGWESQPSLSADGQTLFFVCERKGGFGGKDLWYSTRQTGNRWSEPKNLGAPVNTAQDDQSPFIHPDGQTLYFMSKGHPGMGGFDLYLSRRQADGSWGEPQNLGYPINTKGNEGALSISLDGKTAFFATDILKINEGETAFDNPQGKGTTDIYSFDLAERNRPQPVTYVKATVTDAMTGKLLTANVEFLDLNTGKIFASAVTESDGEFLVSLPTGKDYALNVSKEKYLFYSDNFALKDAGTLDEPFLLNIPLVPLTDESGSVAASKPIVLKNVFFETASAELKKESLIELNRLQKLLADNPSLKIQLNGHTDNVGSDADNLALSENRAKAVFDYLSANGIAVSRLKFKGFGETTPIATNDTEAGRRQNRRTEFILLP